MAHTAEKVQHDTRFVLREHDPQEEKFTELQQDTGSTVNIARPRGNVFGDLDFFMIEPSDTRPLMKGYSDNKASAEINRIPLPMARPDRTQDSKIKMTIAHPPSPSNPTWRKIAEKRQAQEGSGSPIAPIWAPGPGGPGGRKHMNTIPVNLHLVSADDDSEEKRTYTPPVIA